MDKSIPPGYPSWVRRQWTYARRTATRGAYVGWIGHGNLGDELLYLSFRSVWAPMEVLPPLHGRAARWIERVQRRPLYNCCFLGGGTLLNDSGHVRAFRRLLRKYKPGVVFGTGVRDPELWTAWGEPDGMAETVAVLRDCAFVGVRGPMSASILADYGFDSAKVIGDPVLLFADPFPTPKLQRRVLGLNIGASRGHVRGGEQNLLEKTVVFCRHLLRNGWRVLLLPVHNRDVPYLSELSRQLGLPQNAMFRDFLNYGRVWHLLRQVDVFVGEKLHASAAAICCGTPTVMLEYRSKCRDFMLSLGLERYSFPTDEITPGNLLDTVLELYANVDRVQGEIVDATQRLRKRLIAASAKVKRIVRANLR